jgi:hypothetical protein
MWPYDYNELCNADALLKARPVGMAPPLKLQEQVMMEQLQQQQQHQPQSRQVVSTEVLASALSTVLQKMQLERLATAHQVPP